MYLSRTAFAVVSLCLFSQMSFADGVKDCDGALVKATYNKTDQQFLDWRLAVNVDEGSWNTASAGAEANAVIYGIPMGASYKQFQENIKTLKRQSNESLSTQTFRNVAWTGLDETSAKAYAECLRSVSKKNLILIPRTATSTDVSFDLNYTVVGRARNPLPVTWTGVETKKNKLPKTIAAGTTPVFVLRPAKESSLAVGGDGLADTIVLTPMPKPIPPDQLFASGCKIVKTDSPLPQLPAGGSTSWACAPMQAGEYQLNVSVRPSASPAIAFRVLYRIELIAGFGAKARTIEVMQGVNMDINAPGSRLPDVFQLSGKGVTLNAGELVRVQLSIYGVADHCCFDRTGHRDGTVLIPEDVSIEFRKVS